MFRFYALVIAAFAVISRAVQFDIPPTGLVPIEGQPIEIAYSGAQGPVTITLKNGPITDLKTVDIIGRGGSGTGSITWTPEDLPSDTYALEIQDGTDINYSPQFSYQGTGPAVPSLTETDTLDTTPLTTPTPTLTDTTATTATTPAAATETTATTATTDADTTETEPASINGDDNDNGGSAIRSHLGSSMALVLGAAALLVFN